jgi:hypothetical protein
MSSLQQYRAARQCAQMKRVDDKANRDIAIMLVVVVGLMIGLTAWFGAWNEDENKKIESDNYTEETEVG